MSETTTEGTTEVKELPPLKFPDALAEAAYNQIIVETGNHNKLIGQINAVKGDPVQLMDSLRETSKVKAAVAARKQVEDAKLALAEAEEALDSAVKPEFDEARSDAEGKVSSLEEEAKEKNGLVRAAVTYFKKSHAKFFDENKVGERLPKLDRLKGQGGTRSGTGGRRIRGFDIVTVIKGETKQYENMSEVAKDLNVETADLQAGFFAKAGDGPLKDAADKIEWTITVGDGTPEAYDVAFTATRKADDSTEDAAA